MTRIDFIPKRVWIDIALLAVVIGVQPATLQAQRGSAEVQRAETQCRVSERSLMQDAHVDSMEIALWNMKHCPEAGGALVANRWRRPPTDSAALSRLSEISAQIFDARILEAVLEVAADRSKPRAVRVAALVPAWFYVADYRPKFGPLENGVVDIGASVGGARPVTGSRPLPADTKRIVAERMRQLSERPGEDEYMHAVFKQMADRFGK